MGGGGSGECGQERGPAWADGECAVTDNTHAHTHTSTHGKQGRKEGGREREREREKEDTSFL